MSYSKVTIIRIIVKSIKIYTFTKFTSICRCANDICVLYRIYHCVAHLPKLLEQLSLEVNVVALKTMIIDPLKELIEDMDKFQQLVEQMIDLDAAEKGDFMVNPSYLDDFKGYNINFLILMYCSQLLFKTD